MSSSLTGADFGNIAKSGPFTFTLKSSDIPAAAPMSFCSHAYRMVSPSASVALPVSAKGVRSGIVEPAGTVTTGAELPVGVTMPWLSTGPPLSVSPAKPEAPGSEVLHPDQHRVVR